MGNSLLNYFDGHHSDLVSVSDLETMIHSNPADIIPKLLLTRKMKDNDTQQLMLHTNDRTALHFLKRGEPIPSIKDLKGFLDQNILKRHENQREDMSRDTTVLQIEHQTESQETALAETHDEHLPVHEVEQTEAIESENIKLSIEEQIEDSKIEEKIELSAEPIDITPLEDRELQSVDNEGSAPNSQSLAVDQRVDQIKETDTLTDTKYKKANKKTKKTKKYKLKEYSGISPFSKWLLTFKKVDLDKKIKKEEKIAKRKAIEATANRSIEKSTQIISEPLADLLASQGHFDEAKKMYEQLMQKYPEKSSYFAAKINQNIKY